MLELDLQDNEQEQKHPLELDALEIIIILKSYFVND